MTITNAAGTTRFFSRASEIPGERGLGITAETDRATTFPYETVNDPAAQIDGGAEAAGHLSQSDPETDERVVAFLRPRLSAS